ncbi:hypothetical protein MPSEU_000362900 [Mayamaea pseudoterrestris]|nr:hypothetical protein MPSEU_000362900 [Mayamaea pseudoterrestris]
MNNLSQVLSLNKDACSLMVAGDFKRAANILIAALRQIHCCNSQAYLESAMPEENTLCVQPIRIENIMPERSSFYLYNWAFLVTDGRTDVASVHDATRACAILLYNTGLCFQAIGMREGTERESCGKALKLYNMGLSLLSVLNDSDQLLRIALLNNKGYIMHCLYEYKEAQVCLSSLQSLLTRADLPSGARREDIIEILMNVALLFGGHPSAACA